MARIISGARAAGDKTGCDHLRSESHFGHAFEQAVTPPAVAHPEQLPVGVSPQVVGGVEGHRVLEFGKPQPCR